ncbi:transcriptional regulator, LacI family [Ligilactobacillus sp. WC1T17]|uniref:Transcriptional regulator, LacI family n=1 Tax=Ligilactobacillus ruminis TaxID=1623 RepID=A0ABY1AB45_9LACO|nr:transcriptional regulator, LacI family [Ligilactobacillus ruminis]
MKNKVTIKDVARHAGVSMTTVSLILNGKSKRFTERTRQKVFEARDKLNYVPDFNARNLITNAVKTIGVIVPDIGNPFFSTFVKSIEHSAMEENYIPLILSSNANKELELKYLDQLVHRSVNGLIIASPSTGQKEIDSLLKKNHIPYLLIDQNSADGDRVMTDDALGAKLAVDHLIQLGHRKIAMIMAQNPTDNLKRRLQGYKNALASHHIPFDEKLVIPTEMTKLGGVLAAKKLIQTEASAVLTVNDEVALGLYRGLNMAGKKIPADYSVVGYDNIDLDEYLNPPLTSIAQPINDLGFYAFKLLCQRIDQNDGPAQEITLPVKLVVRDSTTKR